MTTAVHRAAKAIPSDSNGKSKSAVAANDHAGPLKHSKESIDVTNADPIIACEALRQQNSALRQELHDIRREMDEITDQFRTEDAEEFKQLQAELEVAAKNCRILQFKLRKTEKRNETIEAEKDVLEEKIQQVIRDNQRVRELDEELLVAKEVSVRLHDELEKSDQARCLVEKLNLSLKHNLDTLRESLHDKLSQNTHDDYQSWQIFVYFYETLFREYMLMEEVTCLHAKQAHAEKQEVSDKSNRNDIADLLSSYQQKISTLNDEIYSLKSDVDDRDREISQLRIQYKILKQRSQSVDRNGCSSADNDGTGSSRSKRGVSVDGGGNLREQLDASFDEIRLLKNKLLRLEDELNTSALEKETLAMKLDQQTKQGFDNAITKDLQVFTGKIDALTIAVKENKAEEKIVTDLQHLLRASRWSKEITEEQLQSLSSVSSATQQATNVGQQAKELFTLLQEKLATLNKIRYRLTNLTIDANDTCALLEELDTTKKTLDDRQQKCNRLQTSVENLQASSKHAEEQLQAQMNKNQALEKTLEHQKTVNNELQQENTRLSTLNAKQLQDLKHVEQLRQSIQTFEKKLDQKQTRVNELSMKIIEKEDIIETKVKECQKHRLELRELESKYHTLGKQLEEQITGMTKEMEKLNMEKEMLRFDLESVRLTQQNDRPTSVKSAAEEELLRVQAECRQQIVESEIDSYKLRLNQVHTEKEELLKMVKDFERKHKELQNKYDADEQSWTRLKADISDKQRKYDESIKIKSELQNAVDRLRQKLYDLEVHSQEKQNKYTIDKQQWEVQRLELMGKINELDEQLSKVTKRQRKDLETAWKKERTDLQKQLQQSQQLLKDMQKQIANRESPGHLTEKINVLMTENELLLNKIRELENIVDDVQLLKNEMQRLREKNAADWNYWRKQQSDLYAQLKQQQFAKEAILNKFDKLQRQISSGVIGHDRMIRDISVGPLSLSSFQNGSTIKTSLSNFSRETFGDDVELPHGTIDGRTASSSDIVGVMDDTKMSAEFLNGHEHQDVFKRTYFAQENTAASLEEITIKIDRVEDNLFSYRRFMDFIRAKSEKGSSIARDDSFTNIPSQTSSSASSKRLASAPPENANQPPPPPSRRSRFDDNPVTSCEHIPSSLNENALTQSAVSPANGSKNRFFSLSRRFRFRTQSPEKPPSTSASVHFLDQDIDLETKERTPRKSDKPSKGILKTLRHRSPFRFRSKDAVIVEQEASPPPPPPPPPAQPEPKAPKPKVAPATAPKHRGRLVELKKTTPVAKPAPSSSASKKIVNVTPIVDPSNSTLVRRPSGLKDLIHRFDTTTPSKPKRVVIDNPSATEGNPDDPPASLDLPNDELLTVTSKCKTIDFPDLLQNVEKEPVAALTKPILRHSNANRQTTSFDSVTSMVSASDSIATTGSARKPTSTARPLMLSVNKEETP